MLLFKATIAGTEDPLDKEVNKNNFVLDELLVLEKIPYLPTALAESRRYEGCFVAGLQNIYQLEEIYGSAGAVSKLDLINSKFIFRITDQQTTHGPTLMLGEQETLKIQGSLSQGSNTTHDIENINNIERKKLLVLSSEIMTLPDLTY